VPDQARRVAFSSQGSLGQEIAAVDRARQALTIGDPVAALSALEDYERLEPSGALRPEATLLRIEALEGTGRHAYALSLAEKFLTAYPVAPQAPRLRSLMSK
jgi:outer membrane protein assembly factor BamD (BamD/ComL family)